MFLTQTSITPTKSAKCAPAKLEKLGLDEWSRLALIALTFSRKIMQKTSASCVAVMVYGKGVEALVFPTT